MKTETKILIGGGIATLVLLLGAVFVITGQSTKEQEKLSKPLIGQEIAIQGENHIPDGTKVDYNSNPPSSGNHYANPELAGIYDNPPPDGNLVHSLEHGAVILWYKPLISPNQQIEATASPKMTELSSQNIEQLKQIYDSTSVGKKIMVPRSNLDAPLALSSWGRVLKLDKIDPGQIKAFLETNEDRGPEKAPL